MITGLKRAPRHALPATLEPYARSPVEIPNPTLRRMEEWFSWRHPVMGSLLLIVALVLVVLEIAEAAAHLNKYLAFY